MNISAGSPSIATTTNGPQVQDHEVLGRDDVPMFIRGRLLGFSSSQTDEHQFHEGEFARPGNRCSACRWFECRIFEVKYELSEQCTCTPPLTSDARSYWATARKIAMIAARDVQVVPEELARSLVQHSTEQCGLTPARKPFLVLTYGLSDVPGEVDKRRASWTDSAFEIIELLTQRGREDRQAFLPAASARALAQAATWSEQVREAYVDRAVV